MKLLTLILSFYLLCVSLMPKLDAVQLTKMSHLLEHYNEHSKLEPISFLEFLKAHYGFSTHSKNHDLNEFPCQDISPNAGFVFVLVQNKKIDFNKLEFIRHSTFFFLETPVLEYSSKIFQPPKA